MLTEEQIKNIPTMPDTTKAVTGKDTLLLVALDDKPTWLLVGGQRNTPISRKAESIDATSKDSGEYSEKLPGMLSWSSNYEGLYIVNDLGYDVLDNRYSSREPAHLRFEYPDGSYRTGWAVITQLDEEHNYNGVSTTKVNFEGKKAISDLQKVENPTVATLTLKFTKGADADQTITVTPADAFVRSVTTNTGEVLKQEEDFSYSGGVITIKKEYLQNKVSDFVIKIKLTANVEFDVKVTVSAS